MKIAIVTDWIYGGGGERVVEETHKLYPEAPIFTSYCSDAWREKLDNKVVIGYLQHWPFRSLRKFLPVLRQRWFRKLDLSGVDLVISITGNGEAKFVRVPNGKHVCYCHTPTHFYWRNYDDYLKNPGFRPKWLVRLGLKLLLKPLRARDYAAAQKVDFFIANSTHIKNDIKEFYSRDSVVIHPPVDVERFKTAANPARVGFVVAGRQTPYKRIDLAVSACTAARLPLTVIGTGPEHDKLVKLAGPTIKFVTDAADADVELAFQKARGFIFPTFEDFGITPVEAMAAGCPIIAFRGGGALDYVIEGETGVFFDEQTVESLQAALSSFKNEDFSEKTLAAQAENFSSKNFQIRINKFLEANHE